MKYKDLYEMSLEDLANEIQKAGIVKIIAEVYEYDEEWKFFDKNNNELYEGDLDAETFAMIEVLMGRIHGHGEYLKAEHDPSEDDGLWREYDVNGLQVLIYAYV